MPSTYDEICRKECVWCAKGFPQIQFHDDSYGHQVSEDIYFPHNVPCTAPTREAVIERLTGQLRIAQEPFGTPNAVNDGSVTPLPKPKCGTCNDTGFKIYGLDYDTEMSTSCPDCRGKEA